MSDYILFGRNFATGSNGILAWYKNSNTNNFSGTTDRDSFKIAVDASHSHSITFNDGSYTSGAHQTHTHDYSFDTSYDGSSTDQESRPDNFTIKIWKRIS